MQNHNPGFKVLTRTGHQPATTISEKQIEHKRREAKLGKAAHRNGGLVVKYKHELSPIILKRITEQLSNYIKYNPDDKTLTLQGLNQDMIYLLMKDVKDENFYDLLQQTYGQMEKLFMAANMFILTKSRNIFGKQWFVIKILISLIMLELNYMNNFLKIKII